MASGDVKLVYGTPGDISVTLASLGPSSSLLTGRATAALDNTSLLVLDYLLSGKIKVNATVTSGGQIQVWAVASWDGKTWPNGFDGNDSSETLVAEIKNVICKPVAMMTNNATGGTTYEFSGVSLRDVFRGVLPPKVSFFVTHNTHVTNALDSTAGSHQIRYQPVYENVAA